MPKRAHLIRRALLVAVALVGVAAFIPTPTPSLEPGPVWTDTATLRGVTPQYEDASRGAPYAPIGLLLLDYAVGLDMSLDPSGATATRKFSFPDPVTARAAAHDAIVAGIRNGYAMQSAPIDQQVWLVSNGVWHDDGCDAPLDTCLTVTLLSPAFDGASTWRVHLLLEHTY